jgi:hypothetical protein
MYKILLILTILISTSSAIDIEVIEMIDDLYSALFLLRENGIVSLKDFDSYDEKLMSWYGEMGKNDFLNEYLDYSEGMAK